MVIDFFPIKFGKFDVMSRESKNIFSNISYKFHDNLVIFTMVAGIQVYVIDFRYCCRFQVLSSSHLIQLQDYDVIARFLLGRRQATS